VHPSPFASSSDMVSFPAFDGTGREAMPSKRELVKGAYAEFVAMLLFVYFGCGAAASNVHKVNGEWDSASVVAIAMVFGLLITVLAYGTAHSSGGHINCAVTFGLTLTGKCHPARGAVYLVAQLVGSIAGAGLLAATVGADTLVLDRSGALGANGFQNASVTFGGAFIAEVMGTALLMYTVLETAVNSKAVTTGEGKQNLAPLPIGLAVFVAHIFLIPITGCSINPTRSFGPALVSGYWVNHIVWWLGPLVGSLLASLAWLLMMKIAQEPSSSSSTSSSAAAVKLSSAEAKV